ncbi:MAG: MFS transporter [Firmicutes bacterium]|nr:MFS transporter [Bacillota bacterium]
MTDKHKNLSAIKEVFANKQGLKVLIAGSVLQLFLGIIYVWNIFVEPVADRLDFSVASVEYTAAFMLGAFVVGIIVAGRLQVRIGAQATTLFGGLLLSGGMFATAFIPPQAAWLIYITYGAVGGLGVGMGYTAAFSSAQKWFPTHRGFVTGVSLAAFGLSAVIFAPLVELLTAFFGVKTMFMILSGIFLCAVLILFSFIKLPKNFKSDPHPASAALLGKDYFEVKEMVRFKEFYLIALSLALAVSAYFVLNPALAVFARGRGFGHTGAMLLIVLAGGGSVLGRLVVLSKKIDHLGGVVAMLIISAASSVTLGFSEGWLFAVAAVAVAFCFGGYTSIYPVITAEYFGVKNVGSNYGAVMVGFGLSALLFPLLFNLFDDGIAKYAVLASLSLAAVIPVVLLMAGKRKFKKPPENNTDLSSPKT